MSIGARFPKQDGVAKADGSGIYADDIALPRMLHAKILRSPHAHARIVASISAPPRRCLAWWLRWSARSCRSSTASSPGPRTRRRSRWRKCANVGMPSPASPRSTSGRRTRR